MSKSAKRTTAAVIETPVVETLKGGSTMFAYELAIFAARFNIPASIVHVLPALFELSAQMAGMSPRALVAEATYRNKALGEYLANAAHKIAE